MADYHFVGEAGLICSFSSFFSPECLIAEKKKKEKRRREPRASCCVRAGMLRENEGQI